jgi:perosamine synthetase
MIARQIGTRYAVAMASGTAALHVAMHLVGVVPDDEVIVPTLTFIAPVNAIRYVGAWPVLMDSEATYWQMDPGKLRDFLTQECSSRHGALCNRVTGRRIKAILPVHILGHPVEMEPVLELAASFGLAVIEDAAESLGSAYKNRQTGSMGNVGCLSFNGNKIITTGGGGAITTNDERIASYARYLSTQAKNDHMEYVHDEVGYNYRLSSTQAAIGVAQMERFSSHMAAKRKATEIYNVRLADVPGIVIPAEAPWARSNCWLYSILVECDTYGLDSRGLQELLRQQQIESRPFWRPAHRQKPYQNCQAYRIEVADRLYREGLSLPCSVRITEEELDKVAAIVQAGVQENVVHRPTRCSS